MTAEHPPPAVTPVRVEGWCRVDLAGGTLDIWPLGLLHHDARTVNLAIDLPVAVEIGASDRFEVVQGSTRVTARTARDLAGEPAAALIGWLLEALGAPPMRVTIDSASPRGGGLGASSALSVALIVATARARGSEPPAPLAVSELARDVEAQLMGLPTGVQDHLPSLLGGALEIRYPPGGERVRRLDCDLDALGASLTVAYTGRSHFSAGSNWEVVRRRLDGEAESIELFDGICAAAIAAAAAIEAGDLAGLGAAMAEEWSFRRRLAPGVSTPEIEGILSAAREAGAWGGKATGAGGGGCVAVLSPAARRSAVDAAIVAAGGELLEAAPQPTPMAVRPL